MIDKLNLYDARVGVETYARLISENIKEQETWRVMVLETSALLDGCLHSEVCWENVYIRSLIIRAVDCVLYESMDFFGASNQVRESDLVRSTRRALEEVISEIRNEVDECYPEGQEAFHK